MKIKSYLLPAAALGAAALVLIPAEEVSAFTTIGGQLSLSQRDFRVFNNFSDSQANNNTTAHANWPGWTGATMALWKGAAEWGSGLHGDGSGDPQQAQVGDGGANFDFAFVGESGSAGGGNANILAELSGGSGGVLAFMQGPISDGWTIKFYSTWVWQDGPGAIGGGGSSFDLQSVGCHELGHALGLGHTNVGGSTMLPSIGAGTTGQRSIGNDDIAGVQSIYGVKSATKPVITSLTLLGGQLTVNGTNFSTTGNEVWFSRQSPTGSGSMVVVSGLNSTNFGTEINVAIPSGVGPGDVLVKKSGTGGSSLSNGYPYDPDSNQFPPPFTYCTGKVSSNGFPPIISFFGTPCFSVNDFTLQVDTLLAFKNGLFFQGTGQANIPFLGGTLCTNPPLGRGPIRTTDSFGTFTALQSYDVTNIGTTINYQAWIRDPQNPDGTGTTLSNAAEVYICP